MSMKERIVKQYIENLEKRLKGDHFKNENTVVIKSITKPVISSKE